MPYIPHTPQDTQEMLAAIGVDNTDALFDEIPDALLYAGFQKMPSGINEMDMLKEAQRLAHQNRNGLCFIGAGCYEHHIPAAVWDIASRGEYLTAYTPYQAEASQGTLQLLYEFQTMICELTGMEVANASMYDGASALAESILMAVRLNKHSKSHHVLIAGTIHPFYRETVETVLRNQNIEITTLPFDPVQGVTAMSALTQYADKDITALAIASPNFFGCLEPVDALCDWAHHNNIISVACVNPISLGVLNPPGLWGERGVDIVCGEGQPLGSPMASGGPFFGFLSTRMEHVRQMPGRLIGRTEDKDGKPGFTLTLQAREQHIRRAKATSNICTNQGLLVTAATIHMSLLGAQGLQQVASLCYENTHVLVEALTQIQGVSQVFSAPYFHEALLRFDRPVEGILEQLNAANIAGGYAPGMHYAQLENTLLVCATEMRSADDLQYYVQTLTHIMQQG